MTAVDVSESPSRVDWAGTLHDVAVDAPRIACLVPSITELLFALGLGDTVVARTGFCVHPRDRIRPVRKIGGTKDPDLRRMEALRPSHLIVNVDENRKEVVDAARRFVPHVIVTHPLCPEDNVRLYALIGGIFGRVDAARNLAGELEQALEETRHEVAMLPRERVLYLIWRKPWMTVARDTYVSATLRHVGFDTLPQESPVRYPVVADADAAWLKADRILLSTEPYAFRQRDADAIAQARGKPVELVDGEWTSWYGARAIPGLRALSAHRRDPHRAKHALRASRTREAPARER